MAIVEEGLFFQIPSVLERVADVFAQFETYHGPGNAKDHGYNGPIHVSDGGYRASNAENDFLTAAGQAGYAEIKDLQNLEANDGFERWLRYVSPEGKRQDTAHTYLHPVLRDGKHPNLHVLVKSKVLRVLFDDNKKAVGVEYTPNPDFQAEIGLTPHPKLTVRAKKLVVVSCGACGTPSVLERSGLGGTAVLEKVGVQQVADLPGVGHDYQDHNLIFYPYMTALDPSETLDDILSGRLDRAKLLAEKNPILGWNGIDISSKLRPTDAEVKSLGPDFQRAWDKDFKDEPNKPLMLMGVVSWFVNETTSHFESTWLTLKQLLGGSINCPTGSICQRGQLHSLPVLARCDTYHWPSSRRSPGFRGRLLLGCG